MSDTRCEHGVVVMATHPSREERCYLCEPVTEGDLRDLERRIERLERIPVNAQAIADESERAKERWG